MSDETKQKLREEFRKLQDGDFFDTDKDGNIYFHVDKVSNFWLEKLDLAVAKREKEIVGEIRQKTLDSWHEAQTLRMNKDGSVSPDVDLDLMGKILLKKINLITTK